MRNEAGNHAGHGLQEQINQYAIPKACRLRQGEKHAEDVNPPTFISNPSPTRPQVVVKGLTTRVLLNQLLLINECTGRT